MTLQTASSRLMAQEQAEPPVSLPTEGRVLTQGVRFYDLGISLTLCGRHAALCRSTADAVSPRDGDRILDVGCGTGILTAEVARRMRSGEVIGIDASGPMIEAARRKRASPFIRYRLAVAEALPFEDASFDAVVSALFFHHVDLDLKERAAREIARVLRPGGRVAVADFVQPWSFFGRTYARLCWLYDSIGVKENVYGAVEAALADAGIAGIRRVRGMLGTVGVISGTKP